MASPYHRNEFSSKIDKAVKSVERILSNARNPLIASPDHDHTYDDKFALSEFLSKVALASFFNTFERLGLDKTTLGDLVKAVSNDKKSVTLRFASSEKCEFIKESTIEIISPEKVVEEHKTDEQADGKRITITSSTIGKRLKRKITSTKIVNSVKQFHWKMDVEYSIYVYTGTNSEMDGDVSKVLISRNPSCEIITRGSKTAPTPAAATNNPIDVSLTWMLQCINAEALNVDFVIDRKESSCRTPRHNNETRDAWTHFRAMHDWCTDVNYYFIRMEKLAASGNDLLEQPIVKSIGLSAINGNEIFVPVLPLFESIQDASTSPTPTSPVLTAGDMDVFLAEQCRTMSEQIEIISSQFSPPSEAMIVLLNAHMKSISDLWNNGILHIENMLYKQLFNAIGKSVDSKDLSEFVRSHNQRLFSDTYAPEPFCYAIRRYGQYPDGIISIEDEANENALTFTRKLENRETQDPMYIPINSATSVELRGDMYLHAWMLQKFENKPSFSLSSRARQFSSFLLIIGKLSGPNTFEPQHGIILQNKDEIIIPLLLDEMPSPQEFKDAIASLSPEQQQFARSFRNMKLSSSVFGVCVIQLKPQLEILLGLPDKSLTKEIRLTQDLLSLFIDYQIPSDLLSFDGPDELDFSEKVGVVKGYAKDINDMIKGTKDEELANAKLKAEMDYAGTLAFGSQDVDSCFMSNEDQGVGDGGFRGGGTIDHDYQTVSSAGGTMSCNGGGKMFGYAAACRAIPSGGGMGGAALSFSGASKRGASNLSPSSMKYNNVPVLSTFNNSEGKLPVVSNMMDKLKLDNDLTMVPKQLDTQFEKFGNDEKYGGALRSTVIKTGECWRKKSKPNIISKPESTLLRSKEHKEEKDKAIDLLDALSRSGSLPIRCAELHVIVASTHCFDKSVINTVVQDNINPIEKIERSSLLVASVIHGVNVGELLQDKTQLSRITEGSSYLLADDDMSYDERC